MSKLEQHHDIIASKMVPTLSFSWAFLYPVEVLNPIVARHGVIGFSTLTRSNDPFYIDFTPKTWLREKSDNVSFDWNLFLSDGQVK